MGYAIGRGFGPAVRRNRGRRRLRAAVSDLVSGLPAGCYLLSADPSVTEVEYPELVVAVRDAMTAAARGTERSKEGGGTGGLPRARVVER